MSDQKQPVCNLCKGDGTTAYTRTVSTQKKPLSEPQHGVRKCRRCKGTKMEPQRT